MKEHLKAYFPERFEDAEPVRLAHKVAAMLDSVSNRRIRLDCERKVQHVFGQSDELRLLARAMKRYGCNFSLSRHVACERCNSCAGGFDPDTKQIVICMNNNSSENKIMATMMHEMIHMFDYCRANFDFGNLDHVACSEIRAANLTYCNIFDRFKQGGPGLFDLKGTHKYCVKDVAFLAVKAYSPESSDAQLWEVIDRVFPACYKDLEPFGWRPSGVY